MRHFIDSEKIMRYLFNWFARAVLPRADEHLAQGLWVALNEINILEKSWIVTTEIPSANSSAMPLLRNGPNNDGVLPISKDCIFFYAAHVLYLTINNAYNSVHIIDGSIGQFRNTTMAFVNLPNLLKAVQQMCTEIGMLYTSLVLHYDTSWYRAWELVDRQLQVQGGVEEVLLRNSHRMNGHCGFGIRADDKLPLPIPSISWRDLQL